MSLKFALATEGDYETTSTALDSFLKIWLYLEDILIGFLHEYLVDLRNCLLDGFHLLPHHVDQVESHFGFERISFYL